MRCVMASLSHACVGLCMFQADCRSLSWSLLRNLFSLTHTHTEGLDSELLRREWASLGMESGLTWLWELWWRADFLHQTPDPHPASARPPGEKKTHQEKLPTNPCCRQRPTWPISITPYSAPHGLFIFTLYYLNITPPTPLALYSLIHWLFTENSG